MGRRLSLVGVCCCLSQTLAPARHLTLHSSSLRLHTRSTNAVRIPRGPAPDSELIRHPGGLVKIGWRGLYFYTSYATSAFKGLFNDSSKYMLTEFKNLTGTLLDYHCFFDLVSDSAYPPRETAIINQFVAARGGRFIIVGGAEHRSSATISGIMRALGLADVQFEASVIRASELESAQDSTSGINDLPVTSGVSRFKLANWSPLKLGPLGAGGDVVLADPGAGKVAMVDQSLGRGAVAVLSCPDVFRMDLVPADGPLLYNLAHRAKESVDQCGTKTTLTSSQTSATTMSQTSATSRTSVTSRTSRTTLTLTTLTWTTALPTTTTAARRRRATPWPGYSR